MSGFLHNLAAKGRGALPRLEPRRPAPYEEPPEGPLADSLEPTPQSPGPQTRPVVPGTAAPSSPTVAAAAGAAPETGVPAAVIPASSQRSPQSPALADTLPASNTLSPTPAAPAPATASPLVLPSATAVAAPTVARRTVDASPGTPAPLVSPSSRQTELPPLSAQAAPSAPGSTEGAARAQPSGTSGLPSAETPRPVIDATQVASTSNSQERTLPTPAERPEPAHEPLLQVEPRYPRPPAQAPAQTPGNAAPTAEAPVVEVHIGTIEVVATQPPAAPMQQHHAAPSRSMSLDDFLDGAGRG